MIKPCDNYIAVQDPPADPQDGTVGGIYLPPGTGLDTISKGIVLAAGDQAETPPAFGPGCVVYYCRQDCLELGLDGSTKFILAGRVIAWEDHE